MILGGTFDVDSKQLRVKDINSELEKETTWSNLELSQSLNKEKTSLEKFLDDFLFAESSINDSIDLLIMAQEEGDTETLNEILSEYSALAARVEELEFNKMFSQKADPNSAFLDIQAGSGGTEAQDWAEMLQRMYFRWAEAKDFSVEIIELSPGEVAGMKSVSMHIKGSYAYGWLRTETGVHRLVRISPFDSSSRRHTSFASVCVYPESSDEIDIIIDDKDLKIDTYRASGAGGQHVNKTDSAIRITHLPTKIIVQCQSDRSQHRNKAHALSMLKAKLYELELKKREEENQLLSSSKNEIGWGSQIRSYVLHPYNLVKDLRTNVETGNTVAVLDGELDQFINEALARNL